MQREHRGIGIHVSTLDAFECYGHRAMQLTPQAERKRLVSNLAQCGPLEPDMAVWIASEHTPEPQPGRSIRSGRIGGQNVVQAPRVEGEPEDGSASHQCAVAG